MRETHFGHPDFIDSGHGPRALMRTDLLLAAVDLTPSARDIVREASQLAERLSAELVLVHVLPVAASVHPDVLKNPKAHPAAAAHMRERENAVVPELRKLAEAAKASGVRIRLQVAHGDPADAILRVADDLSAGMIVVGTHGRAGLVRVALGSVAESVIRESTVPVVTIRARTDGSRAGVAHHEVPLDGDPSES